MKAEGIEPTENTYGNCISALAKSGDWEGALKHFEEMLQNGLKPTRKCYNSALDACAKGRLPQRTDQILQHLMTHQVEANAFTFSASMRSHFDSQQYNRVCELFEQMQDMQIEPCVYR